MSFKIHTQWQLETPKPKPTTDEERHEMFSRFVQKTLDQQAPWLVTLLSAANATVYAAPGSFYFATEQGNNTWHEIPPVSKIISMVPWADDGEVSQ